jgi:hypothetical protein
MPRLKHKAAEKAQDFTSLKKQQRTHAGQVEAP